MKVIIKVLYVLHSYEFECLAFLFLDLYRLEELSILQDYFNHFQKENITFSF